MSIFFFFFEKQKVKNKTLIFTNLKYDEHGADFSTAYMKN